MLHDVCSRFFFLHFSVNRRKKTPQNRIPNKQSEFFVYGALQGTNAMRVVRHNVDEYIFFFKHVHDSNAKNDFTTMGKCECEEKKRKNAQTQKLS